MPKTNRTQRRTKKAAVPSAHAVLVELFSIAGTPEADKLLADLEAEGATRWATGLRKFFHDTELERRVGLWEDRNTNRHGVWLDTLAAVQQYVNRLWADLGYADPPTITKLSAEEMVERPNVIASANEKEIRLPGDHANANIDTVILHEAAHVIARRLGICDGHGPKWFGIYLSLLERLGRIDMAALKTSATAAGFLWTPFVAEGLAA